MNEMRLIMKDKKTDFVVMKNDSNGMICGTIISSEKEGYKVEFTKEYYEYLMKEFMKDHKKDWEDFLTEESRQMINGFLRDKIKKENDKKIHCW